MPDLAVVGFKNEEFRALEVLEELRQLDFDWAIHLRNAMAIYREPDGTLRLQRRYDSTAGDGGRWGGLWGSLVGAIFLIPFTGGTSAAGAAALLAAGAISGTGAGAAVGAIDASWWKDEFQIDSAFMRGVSSMIQPGDSAIFALIDTPKRDLIASHFTGYGGTVLRSSLRPAQEAALQNYLQGDSRTTDLHQSS
jgi:uncharacterized membrane protein